MIKRVTEEKKGELLKDLKSCSIYINIQRYEFSGRFHSQLLNLCIKDLAMRSSSDIPKGLYIALDSMRTEEKAWITLKNK